MASVKQYKIDDLYINGISELEIATIDGILMIDKDEVERCGPCFRQGIRMSLGDNEIPRILVEKCLRLLIDVGFVHDLNEREEDGTVHISFNGDYYLTAVGRSFSGLGGFRHYISEINKDAEKNRQATEATISSAKNSKQANTISIIALVVSVLTFISYLVHSS